VHPLIKGLVIAAIPVATVAILAGSASASVSSTFIGKGDVQTALGGINNAKIQSLVDNSQITFSSSQAGSQPVKQALTQDGVQSADQEGTQAGVQSGSQSATQTMLETLTCRKTTGAVNSQYRYGTRNGEHTGTRTSERDAIRTATRSASRSGSQTGSQTGSVSGSVNAAIDAQARKTGQWTGWKVNNIAVNPQFVAGSAAPVWTSQAFNDNWAYTSVGFTFGDYDFTNVAWTPTGDYAFGDYTYGPTTWADDYIAAANEDPEGVCLKANGQIGSNVDPASVVQSFSVVSTVEHDVVDGAVAPGRISDGLVEVHDVVPGVVHTAGDVLPNGAYSASGPVSIYVTAIGYPGARLVGSFSAV